MNTLALKSSVYPPGYYNMVARSQNPEVSYRGRSTYPDGTSKEQWEAQVSRSMRGWYDRFRIGMAYATGVDLARIDNMNKHLFNI